MVKNKGNKRSIQINNINIWSRIIISGISTQYTIFRFILIYIKYSFSDIIMVEKRRSNLYPFFINVLSMFSIACILNDMFWIWLAEMICLQFWLKKAIFSWATQGNLILRGVRKINLLEMPRRNGVGWSVPLFLFIL